MTHALQMAAAALTACLMAGTASAERFLVEPGMTEPLRLRGEAASVVIGDPEIADVAVHDEHLLLVTGKAPGKTNLLVLDRDGRSLYAADIMVARNASELVRVNRAGQGYNYDCAPTCRITAD
jgi:Flp pilus assembly secretin CpaC